MIKAYDYCIINRTFWPENKTIGEGLLNVSENLANKKNNVLVICQSNKIKEHLDCENRGKNVTFKSFKDFNTRSSGIVIRSIEAFAFAIWVAMNLCTYRPKVIYIATDPPIIIPFIVVIISKVIRSKVIYHFQDIHPEIFASVKKIPIPLYNFLKFLDAYTQRQSTNLITINEQMKEYLVSRVKICPEIHLVSNPANMDFSKVNNQIKKLRGFVYCGTIGRLQLIPILLKAIEKYLNEGGSMSFTFIGDGVNKNLVSDFANNNKNFDFLGQLSEEHANAEMCKYEWALLPIEAGVLDYAFPSKSSAYEVCDCKIFSISDANSSLAKWVTEKRLGINSEVEIKNIVEGFWMIENEHFEKEDASLNLNNRSPSAFASKITDILKANY